MATTPGIDPTDRRNRGVFFDTATSHTPLIGVRAGESSFLIPTSAKPGWRRLFIRAAVQDAGILRRAHAALASHRADWSPREGRFVDVGAGIGTTTVTALLRWEFDGAIALEPAPDSERLLRMNLILNDVDGQVDVHRVAIGKVDGIGELVLDSADWTQHRVREHADAGARASDQETAPVSVASLDQLVETGVLDSGSISLLWVDASWSMPSVFAGAQELLRRAVPAVATVNPQHLAGNDSASTLMDGVEEYAREYVDLGDVPHGEEQWSKRRIRTLRARAEDLNAGTTHVLLLPRARRTRSRRRGSSARTQ